MDNKKSLRKVEFDNEPASLDSKIISEIDVNLIISNMSNADAFLDEYNHCPLCGTELLYAHVTHFVNNRVHEEAHCEKCNVRTKSNLHSLQ
jgi:hypothetical protein